MQCQLFGSERHDFQAKCISPMYASSDGLESEYIYTWMYLPSWDYKQLIIK